MPPRLSLENDLILACARTALDVRRIQALVARGPNWPLILWKVERWGLASLVWTNLQKTSQAGQVPTAVAIRLRFLYRRDTIHGVARRKVLRAALQRFSEAGIPVIVLKGVTLATLVYPSAALRPTGKIDLLVRGRDRDRVDDVLRGMSEAEDVSLVDVRAHLFGAGTFANRLSAARISIEDFWTRARPLQIESVATLVLSHEDLLLHLALHLVYARRFSGQARTLCDIAEMCMRYKEAIDWSRLVTRAEAYDVGKELYQSLRLSRELVEASVPSDVLTELRTIAWRLPLEERLIANVARQAILSDQTTGPLSKAASLAARVLATRRPGNGVMRASRRLSRSWRVRPQRSVTSSAPWGQTSDTSAQLPATVIVLPIYRPCLDAEVLADVDRAFAVLRHGDWHLIAPHSLDTSFYEQRYEKPIVRFPDECLASVENYSRLLLSDEFYAAFARYEYILVVQDDVYVLRDDLPYWLRRRLDYIGAPWPEGHEHTLHMSQRHGIRGHTLTTYVGNGGFSLRRIAACRQLLDEFAEEVAWFREHGWAEDMFFGLFGHFSQRFVLPNLRVAARFAWEVHLPRMHALCQGQLPMAIHGHRKWDPEFFLDTILPAPSSGC